MPKFCLREVSLYKLFNNEMRNKSKTTECNKAENMKSAGNVMRKKAGKIRGHA
jgi:hypothetical protein